MADELKNLCAACGERFDNKTFHVCAPADRITLRDLLACANYIVLAINCPASDFGWAEAYANVNNALKARRGE